MKWRMADVIDEVESWRRIAGRKAVSLEEYDLLRPLGRPGVCPESLLIESAVAFGRWLVVKSSEFTESALLDEVTGWKVHQPTGRGSWVQVVVTVESTTQQELAVLAELTDAAGNPVATGRLRLRKVPLAELVDPESLRLLWTELKRG